MCAYETTHASRELRDKKSAPKPFFGPFSEGVSRIGSPNPPGGPSGRRAAENVRRIMSGGILRRCPTKSWKMKKETSGHHPESFIRVSSEFHLSFTPGGQMELGSRSLPF